MDADSFKDMFNSFRTEMSQDLKKEMNERFDTFTEKFGAMLKNHLSSLDKKLKDQEEKISQLEKDNKRKNLIIHGVEEKTDENLEDRFFRLIRHEIGVEIENWELDFIRRLGKKTGNTKRPIVIGLTTWRKKMEILKNKGALKGKEVFITEDFPRDVLQKRKELKEDMFEARKQGKYAVLKYDKLFIGSENGKTKKKRELSISPQKEEQNTKPAKKRDGKQGSFHLGKGSLDGYFKNRNKDSQEIGRCTDTSAENRE
ncbi:uncharacterized protein LOC120355146 [Nilaparvata lugens]|uniref:uncharacterized protein LOC120355146 n=1 Tax=Nilaparvata lugens TaxID=108931 RepID=UPI00193CC1AE|nr:uncharacterized protein LOC120355146 [Nilaparvata lugens]